jgi:hypothetical protein
MARSVPFFWKANTPSATWEISHPSRNQADHKHVYMSHTLTASQARPLYISVSQISFAFRCYYNFALVFIGQKIVITLFSSYTSNPQVKPYKTACNIIIWRLQSSALWRNAVR